jgi:uncharacterized protein
VLFGHTDRSFYLREIARRLHASPGAVQRELAQLFGAGLVQRESSGHQVFYRANKSSPVFGEMRALVAKTVGTVDVLRSVLKPLSKSLRVAFVYGSVARHEEAADSDIDLMVVGDVGLDQVIARVAKAQTLLGREINPTVYSLREFRAKLTDGNHFLRSVIKGEKLFVIGSADELAQVGGIRVAAERGNQSR